MGGAGVVTSVLTGGLTDGQPGHGCVGRSHPQGVLVLPHQPRLHPHAGLEVDHVEVVIPEHKLGSHEAVAQLADDGDTVPEVDVFLPGAQDGGGGLVDPEPGGESLDTGACGRLVTLIVRMFALQSRVKPTGTSGNISRND